jgi:GGDEF domain-containing protein
MSEPKHPSQGKAPASQTAKSATQEHEHFLSQLQKVHRTINSLVINDVEGIHVGVSIGWAHCINAESIVDTFRRADSALYRAKDKGRNLIING